MTRIEARAGVVTQINIFKTNPQKVDLLVETLKEAAQAVKHVPGWLSINLHVALDRSQVANYAQCETKEAWEEVMTILFQKGFIDRIVALAPPDPCLYEVEWTLDRADPT
jgi:hypothetical protein